MNEQSKELVADLRSTAAVCGPILSMPDVADLLRQAAARIEYLERERADLAATLEQVLDAHPEGDCWCHSGHSQNETTCMGCLARKKLGAYAQAVSP